ncbi:ATP-binding protein [Lentisphaera profundi]|uniref:ATP-binding protein n=1 Tax=Lentisphaera profundi TaxID=1658616 RepID=A0ABY7VUB9_9BACT|nr:ATP-binding protein [Lentisphaera profundi]WDE97785.1 ATP-binding protein [Lentisphaera profundi]
MRNRVLSKKVLLSFIPMGAIIGVFVLKPLVIMLIWLEFKLPANPDVPLPTYVVNNMLKSFSFEMILVTLAFASIGMIIGLVFWLFLKEVAKREQMIDFLTNQPGNDLAALIAVGENDTVEFKSSMRWDYQNDKLNKVLEVVIIKTIAGFLNTRGGTLLIGVDDDGLSLGLDKDYSTLKKKNSDGYEQYINGLISSYLGTDLCAKINIMFHQLDDKEICRILILPAKFPVYSQNGNKTQFFMRAGGGTRELNIKEAMKYISSRWESN